MEEPPGAPPTLSHTLHLIEAMPNNGNFSEIRAVSRHLFLQTVEEYLIYMLKSICCSGCFVPFHMIF
jgi:hypothetical protein